MKESLIQDTSSGDRGWREGLVYTFQWEGLPGILGVRKAVSQVPLRFQLREKPGEQGQH